MKRVLLGILLIAGLGSVAIIALNLTSSPPNGVGTAGNTLAPCPDSPNCVSSTATDEQHEIEPLPMAETPEATIELLATTVNEMSSGQSVLKKDRYLHAEYRSPWLRYVDDVEFLVDEDNQVVQVRSASRIGHSDMGVNRARIEDFRSVYEHALSRFKLTEHQSVDTTGEDTMPDEIDEFATVEKTDEEWRKQLTSDQYRVTRQHGTERAFTGPNWDNKEPGTYLCVCCELPLFSSETKYESGTGWPSFWRPLKETSVETQVDVSFFMRRTEVHCRRCKAHLGHVFEDGPDPTGLRYCMNGVAMMFEPAQDDEAPTKQSNNEP